MINIKKILTERIVQYGILRVDNDEIENILSNPDWQSNNKYNIKVYPLYNGIKIINFGVLYNLIFKNKLLYEDWFKSIRKVDDKEALIAMVITIDDKYNMIDSNGRLMFSTPFSFMGTFRGDGICPVRSNEGKRNFIDTNGDFIFDTWYDKAGMFQERNLGWVELDKKYKFVDKNGNMLSNRWFDSISTVYELFLVTYRNKKNLVDYNGQLVSKIWYDDIVQLQGTKNYCVELGSKFNLLSQSGDLMSDKWFDFIDTDYNFLNYSKVGINDKYNLMNEETGEFASEIWFDYILRTPNNKLFKVKYDFRWNVFNLDTKKIISDEWFSDVDVYYGFPPRIEVELKGKWNLMSEDGEFLSNWVSSHELLPSRLDE